MPLDQLPDPYIDKELKDDSDTSKEGNEMSFLEHLEDLRWHLIRASASILVFSIVAFIFSDFFFGKIVLGPAKIDFISYQWMCMLAERFSIDSLCVKSLDFVLQSRKMTGQFMTHISYSLIFGFILSFPYIFWEIWRFVKPGLYKKEQNITRGAVFWVSLLFLLGISFGYFIISPISVIFLSGYSLDPIISNEFDISNYFSTLAMIVLSSGIIFELPVIMYVLTKAGLVTPTFLTVYRKHAIVIIVFIAAIITPPDVMSQVLISIPLVLLYEVSIIISRAEFNRQNRENL